MAVLEIIKMGHPALRKVAVPGKDWQIPTSISGAPGSADATP